MGSSSVLIVSIAILLLGTQAQAQGQAAHDHDHAHAHGGHDHDHAEYEHDHLHGHEQDKAPGHGQHLTILDLEQLAELLRSAAQPSHGAHGHSHQHAHAHGHDGHDHAHGHEDHGHADTTVSVRGLINDDSTQEHYARVVTLLIECARDAHCTIADPHASASSEHQGHGSAQATAGGLFGLFQTASGGTVSGSTKAVAAAVLFVETIIGMLVPPFVSRMDGHAWWLSLLNSFSGGIFLTAGLMHLIPHCAEAQFEVDMTLWHLPAHYPMYLLLICLGYLLVFAVERVAFEGHDHGHHGHSHSHGPEGCSPHADDVYLDEMFAPIGKDTSIRKRRQEGTGPPCPSPDCRSPDHHKTLHTTHSHKEMPDLTALHTHQHEFKVARGVPLLVGMSVHTFLECLALGLITKQSSFMVLLAAIAAHKGVSALALAAKFTKEGATLKQVLLLVGPFTLLAPSAIAAGHLAGSALPPAVQLLLNCLATGTFLYVGASEILPEEFEGDVRAGRKDMSKAMARVIKFVAVLAAVACIAALGLMPHVH